MTERDDDARLVAWHHEMTAVHVRLREALQVVRAALADGQDPPAPERELLLYCHGFCAALDGHHAAEDVTLFTALEEQRPELAPILRRLEDDHSMIGHLLHGVRQVLDRQGSVDVVERHLEGVAAIMESHFRHEERMLLPALEHLALEASPREAFGPLAR